MGVIHTADLAESGRANRGRDGKFCTRIFLVNQLSGSTPSGMLLDALSTTPGLPIVGNTHPDDPSIQVINAEARPWGCLNGTAAAHITVSYGPPAPSSFTVQVPDDNGPAVKQVRGSVVSKQVTRDINDDLIEVAIPPSWVAAADAAGYSAVGELPSKAVPLIQQVPVLVLTFERLEESMPASRVRQFLGKTNSAGVGPYAADTLLCTRLDSVTRDGGLTYETTYEFLHDPEGFAEEVVYTLQNGQVPPYDPTDPLDDVAHRTFVVQDSVSFASLNLDFFD